MKYHERSLMRKMAMFILSTEKVNFTHKLLKKKLAQFALSIPTKKLSTAMEGTTYYNHLSRVRDFLMQEHKKILINVRGFGYKIADDDEKNIEGFKKTEKAFELSSMSNKILDTVDITNLDKDGKELYHQLKVTNSLRGKIHTDLLENLKSKELLPEPEKKDKK